MLRAQNWPNFSFQSIYPYSRFQFGNMGKQLSPEEDEAHRHAALRLTPTEVWEKSKVERARRRIAPPDLTTVRHFLKGKTHTTAAHETRSLVPSLVPSLAPSLAPSLVPK